MQYGGAFRESLAADGLLVAPGVHDPLSARVADHVGFEAVAMTGNGTSVARLGRPDVGLITLPEMVENANRIQETVDVPIIADADTGYGNAINVTRTVREFAKAGVGAIHLEDQRFPKRCGFLEGKQVISREKAVGKIRAAAETRDAIGTELVVIARTDARGAPGGTLESAIDRATAYCEAGADVAFVQGTETADELERVAEAVDAPLLYNCSGGSPIISLDRAAELGYDIAMFPRISTNATIAALFDAYAGLAEAGMDGWRDVKPLLEDCPIEDYDTFTGVPEILELEDRYLPAE